VTFNNLLLIKISKMLSKALLSARTMSVRGFSSAAGAPKRVVVTGAAGQISYSVLFRIAR
jgi:hypothetical protein